MRHENALARAALPSGLRVNGADLRRDSMNFLSDNAYGTTPEILAALSDANSGAVAPYGEDDTTTRLKTRFSELFERDVAVFPVVTGTAANALALATVSPP